MTIPNRRRQAIATSDPTVVVAHDALQLLYRAIAQEAPNWVMDDICAGPGRYCHVSAVKRGEFLRITGMVSDKQMLNDIFLEELRPSPRPNSEIARTTLIYTP
jgi:uncharacterized protein YcgI (DUF1989 family)